ncbi:hypothetical protein PC129_g15846 [Phytophthora cactorum]|uniref:Uncharacterized protein n=1 Tax=Phytophthora cactorum TaxID=29920 RepID=A0A8T1HKT4_9STRA|nr:hypothetical protein PC117_g18797 [Phytophthora cactorum]KAG2992565.1 hypothetical protein PC119_g18662 [Phytophthora cactorum]KAG3213214.1 hypothetical protein PC129_g15846 [Phytophthora cactorum]
MAHIINRAFVVHQGKRALSNFGKVPCLVGSNADLDNTDSALSLATGLSCDDTREKETWQRGSVCCNSKDSVKHCVWTVNILSRRTSASVWASYF